jgi:hypothetical protein
MATPVRVLERELGLKDEALKRVSEVGSASDAESVKAELAEAPPEYEKGITSVVRGDVFGEVEPQFPTLLKKQTEHRMQVAELMNELALIIGMGDIKDSGASVFIYSIQILDPSRLPETEGWKIVQQAAPADSWIELRNGYVRHDLLYDLPDSDRSIVLLNLLQFAKKVLVSLKPPWSNNRIDTVVALIG